MFVALLQIYGLTNGSAVFKSVGVLCLDCTRTCNAFDHILKENVEAKNIFIFSILGSSPCRYWI